MYFAVSANCDNGDSDDDLDEDCNSGQCPDTHDPSTLRARDNDDTTCVGVAVSARRAAPAVDHGREKSRRHHHDNDADGSTTDSDSDNDDYDASSTSSSSSSPSLVIAVAASADSPVPLQSCLSGKSTQSRDVHAISWDDVADVTEYAAVGSMRPYIRKGRRGIHEFPPWQQHLLELRQRDRAHRQASGVTTAKCLSHLHGYAVDHGWPVLWENGEAHVYYPPRTGIISTAYLTTSNMEANYMSIDRADATAALHETWDQYLHLGEVPTDEERAARIALPPDSKILSNDLVKIHLIHERSDESEGVSSTGGKAMPCPELVGKAVRVKSWLMDSGASEDLICRKSIRAANRAFVKACDPITLDTANGELVADNRIDLYAGVLGERIAPLVLDSTPDVMSLGRRVEDQGFIWHWEPGDCHLIHPATKERIALRVENYCPYLDDRKTTYPIDDDTYDDVAADRCVSAPAPGGGNSASSSSSSSASPTHSDDAESAEQGAPVADSPGGQQQHDAPSDTRSPTSHHKDDAVDAGSAGGEEDIVEVVVKQPRDLKVEAMSLEHLLDHANYNPYCESCVRAKMTRRPARRQTRDPSEQPENFGDLVNADFVVSQSDEAMGLTGERDALVILDRASRYKDCFPLQSRNAADAAGALGEFMGDVKPKRMYTDNEPSLIRACKDLRYPHDKSTPHRHQSNAHCERQVRSVVEGARTLLEHAGLPSCFWIFAVRFWCFMSNVRVVDGESAWNKRHGKGHFGKPLIPFGARVNFLPRPDTVRAMPKFEPRSQPGILVGYRLHRGAIWAKDYLVFPLHYFVDYDYNRPRNLTELVPITTQECSVSLQNGSVFFPCKHNYDLFKHSLPRLSQHGCIIRDVDNGDPDVFVEKEDSETPAESVSVLPPTHGVSPDESAEASKADDQDDESYYKADAIGRYYKYDRYGNRIYSKPLKGTPKPPEVSSGDWRALSKKGKQQMAEIYAKAKQAGIQVAVSASTPSSTSTSAAARGAKGSPERIARASQGNGVTQFALLCSALLSTVNLGIHEDGVCQELVKSVADILGKHGVSNGCDGSSDSMSTSTTPTTHDVIGSDDDDDFVPKFPCVSARKTSSTHRRKSVSLQGLFNACVARPVKPAEAKDNPKAKAAMQEEWDRLRAVVRPDGTKGVWDEHLVANWRDVRRNARRKGRTVHVGRVFGIIVEKNHELDPRDPRRKYKGRAVFGGDNVKDQDSNWAIFQELGSSPATMDAARAADAYGLFPGHAVQQSDARQAYTQAWLRGTETWVRLPRDQWPEGWDGQYDDPVCPLRLALYGHPDAGTDWEMHSQEHVTSVGFDAIPNWPSCFWHPELRLLLVIYVDDFKLAGPSENLAAGWNLIRQGLDMDPPDKLGLFLGCKHEESSRVLPDTGVTVRVMEYNMEDFLKSCVSRYQELTGVQYLRHATTPFLPEPTTPDFSDGYPTDEEIREADEQLRAACAYELPSYAAKVLMKILYAARYARHDLLRAVCYLAQFITKWNEQCDRRLYRLVSYIHSTYHIRMTGWVGDDIKGVSPHIFADADFAGDSKKSRSTSGFHLALLGPSTVFPLAGQSKKQGCVSHSTPEAEVVAADHALRTAGIPCLDLWDLLLGRKAVLDFHEDNETAIGAMRYGYSPALRHISRTHGVCIRWLAERFKEPAYQLYYERSALQAADIFTKAFTVPAEWDKACRLINVLDPKRFWEGPRVPVSGEMSDEHKGGVIFAYWHSNPWLNRITREIPKPTASEAAVPANTRLNPSFNYRDNHVSWLEQAEDKRANGVSAACRADAPAVAPTDVVEKPYYSGYFDEAPDCDDDDYASTAEPDSDEESLSEFEAVSAPLDNAMVPGGDGELVASAVVSAATTVDASVHDPLTDHTSPSSSSVVYTRRIVEFCCGAQSRIGTLAPPDCDVVRLTIDDDMTTEAGVAKAIAAVSQAGIQVLLFGSIPCTGGSPYTRLNWHLGPDTRRKIRAHRALFRKLWLSFEAVAAACVANGGHIAIEWPQSCSYWKVPRVRSFIKRYALQSVSFDGCAYGLVSQVAATAGRPIRKPWCIASNCEAFQRLCRACDHRPHEHVRLQGTDTKLSESYTDELVHAIHECWYTACDNTHTTHDGNTTARIALDMG